MFADPPPLDCPSLKVLRELCKDALQDLAREEAAIQRTTGASLVIKETLFENESDSNDKIQKKSRTHATCQQCKKRKIACDGYQPCNRCAKQPEECHYAPGAPFLLRRDGDKPPPPSAADNNSSVSSSSTRQQFYFINRFSAKQSTFPTPPTNAPSSSLAVAPPPPPPPPKPAITSSSIGKHVSTDTHGHFFGETSFFLASSLYTHLPFSHQTFSAATVFPTQLLLPPDMSFADAISLVDEYYSYADPFYPIIMNKHALLEQLKRCINNEPACLSPLYFNAIFLHALAIRPTDKCEAWSAFFMDNVLSTWSHYLDNGHFSTILALVALANHLERIKASTHLTRAWTFAGVAARLAVDMGYHRIPSSSYQAQTAVRTFWTCFVTERTFCMMYGRPSMLEERDMYVDMQQNAAFISKKSVYCRLNIYAPF